MTRSRSSALRRLTPVLLVLGVVVMIAFEDWYTLLVGMLLLVAFVVCGTFLIADPEGFLDRDADGDEPAPAPEPAAGGVPGDGAA